MTLHFNFLPMYTFQIFSTDLANREHVDEVVSTFDIRDFVKPGMDIRNPLRTITQVKFIKEP